MNLNLYFGENLNLGSNRTLKGPAACAADTTCSIVTTAPKLNSLRMNIEYSHQLLDIGMLHISPAAAIDPAEAP